MTDLGLFEGFGVEIEHMIVDASTMEVRPCADRILVDGSKIVMELEDGDIAWSNELALHVNEMKSNGPAGSLEELPERFWASTHRLMLRLPTGSTLLPGAMHPFMNPAHEFIRWPHGDREIYEAFDRIFDCRGHGWSNLQSVHLNLPFCGDDEFGRLHAAIRLLLPILPALTAASPYYDGCLQPYKNGRLHVYRSNAKKIPLVSGSVIPEPARCRSQYEREILEPMYAAIRPFDPEALLQHEWLNARGAIARFDRSTIEIRTIDAQENATANIAICAAIVEVLRFLLETDQPPDELLPQARLVTLFDEAVRDGEDVTISDGAYLNALSFPGSCTDGRTLWRHLLEATGVLEHPIWRAPLGTIVEQGTLATRLVRAGGMAPDRKRLVDVSRDLVSCLLDERPFAA